MLDQDADEPFERPEHRAVDHGRARLAPFGRDVLEVESLGKRVIDLNRAELMLPLQRIEDLEIDLRRIEGTAAGIDLIRGIRLLDRALQQRLGLVPQLDGSLVFLGPRGEIDPVSY